MRFRKSFFSFPVLYLFLFACNPVKRIPEGKYLLVKNEIKTDTSIIQNDDFEKHIKQKPNRKILGFIRFHLGLYNLAHPEKDSSWFRKIGEPPVLYDSALTVRSKEQLKLFLNKNGFFNARVTDSLRLGKKRAAVEYHISYNTPYTIRNIYYSTQDTGIVKLIKIYENTSILIKGERYDEAIFDNERERITADLKDRGYYFFNRNFITFQIDSSLNTHEIDVYMYINRINENLSNAETSSAVTDHQPYRLRNIYIQTGFDPKDPASTTPKDTTLYENYYILTSGTPSVLKYSMLTKNFFIKPGDLYLQRDLDQTYAKLQELNVYKFINLYFTEVPRDDAQKEYLLDLQIQLTPMDKMDFTEEFELTHTGSNIGIAGSLSYRNKNTFRGAEVLEVRLRGGLDALPNTQSTENNKKFLVFNTYEIGPEVSLSFKKLLGLKGISRYSNPKTTISIGYNHQNSPDYIRSIWNSGFIWSLNLTSKQRLTFGPTVNSVVVNLNSSFANRLNELNDPQLLYAYETHVISSVRVTWSTSSQTPVSNSFVFFRTNGEYAFKTFPEKLNPSRFYKIDYDFSHYYKINKYNTFVSHIGMGIGIPYGQSLALPFEKSFFAGGANSNRAWFARTLGPGSYRRNIDFEQSGDIKLETNIEYRSELFEFRNGIKVEGASFIDAGNVWTRNEDVSRPGGKFEAAHLLRELGIGAGLGLRFNFTFFVFRLDGAVKLHDPSLDEGMRWVYPNQKFVIGDIAPNLAIGYPF